MKSLIFILALMPVFSLAVQQIAYILMHGSIFDWLRNGISSKSQNLKGTMPPLFLFFWKKMNQLLSCNLCLTSQVSIWFVAVPVYLFLFFNNHHFLMKVYDLKINMGLEVFMNLLTIFLYAMATASLAIIYWNLVEYLPKKLKIQQENLKAQLQMQAILGSQKAQSQPITIKVQSPGAETKKKAAKSDSLPKAVNQSKKSATDQGITLKSFTFDDFKKLIKFVDSQKSDTKRGKMKCEDIFWCDTERQDCRQKHFGKFIQDWYLSKNINDPLFFVQLSLKVEAAARKYYNTNAGYDMEDYYKIIFDDVKAFT